MANNQDRSGTQSAWQKNQEADAQENSSATNDIKGDNEATETAESSWRPTESGWQGASAPESLAGQSPAQTSDVNIQNSETGNKTGDPGRTPGKAEGEEDFQDHGNE